MNANNCPACGQAVEIESNCPGCGQAIAVVAQARPVASIVAVAVGLVMITAGYAISATGALTSWAWEVYRTHKGSLLGSFTVLFSHAAGDWLAGLGVLVALIGAVGIWRARQRAGR